MKRLLTAAIVILMATPLHAQTIVSGTINQDSTWSLIGSPYIVQGLVTVANGATLTIDSAVVVRFDDDASLTALGTLNARYALFTSRKDTTGGSPARGDWAGIQVGDWSNNGAADFDHCVVRYGGYQHVGADAANLFLYHGSLTLTACEISLSNNSGVMYGGGNGPSTLTLTNTSVSSCIWPLRYRAEAALVLNGSNALTSNVYDAILIGFGSIWGTMTLPLSPVPFVTSGHLTVEEPGSFTITSGVMLKVSDGAQLAVKGRLSAIANAGEKVLFTSVNDDNAGGDTNNDGGATTSSASSWQGIVFEPTSIDTACVLRRAEVRFAGHSAYGGVTTRNASPTIDSCDFNNNYFGLRLQGVSNPVLSNNVIGSSTLVPIALSWVADPVMTNNAFSFSDNRYDAIGLLGGELPIDGVLPVRSVTAVPNVTYLLLEDVVVPAGRTLTIHERVVIKALFDWPYVTVAPRITVKGKLVATATSDSTKIVLTSARDDSHGNPFDTNKDGTSSAPERGNWGGIVFEGTSDTSSVLNRCVIKYASLPDTYYHTRWINSGAVTLVNASPNLTNVEITDVVYGLFAFQVSKPKLQHVLIANAQRTPIAMSVSADPQLTDIAFVNAGWRALGIIGENLGSNGTIRRRNVAGFTNITYVLLEDLTINSGTQALVEPGIVLKLYESGIFVDGGFKAKGTIAEGAIIFTSLADDNFGNPGDTNGDGAASAPAAGAWKTIRYRGTSDDAYSLLDSCEFRFGGRESDTWGAVSFVDANTNFRNSLITNSHQFGLSAHGSAIPIVDRVDIRNCRLDPIAMSLTSDPVFTNIMFTANRSNGVKILEGTLSSNARLRRRDIAGITNVAYIVDYLTIAPNAILTIDPGVVIKFPKYYYWFDHRWIHVEGGLIAEGTPSQRIVFTSLLDDSRGGDTNNDGNATTPERGDWHAVQFLGGSIDTVNRLRLCDFRYGGATSGWDHTRKDHGMVSIHSSRVLIDSCSFDLASSSGLGIYGSADPTVSHCQFSNMDLTPVTMSLFATPSFSDNVALNVGYMALGIVPETYSVTASVPKRDFGGFTNITYLLMGGLGSTTPTINSGTTITIPKGVVFKYYPATDWTSRLHVQGALVINGTPSAPVVFTDPRDDSAGNPGDSNGDGLLTAPTIWDSPAIYFEDVSDDSLSVIRSLDVRYRSYGIHLQQASPTILRSRFANDTYGILLNGVSAPAVDSCTFHNLTYAPIQTSLVSYPRSTTGNVISGKTYRAIGVVNETLAQDATLTRRNFAGVTNIPYLFHQYAVGTSAVLTIDRGVILKFLPEGHLSVSKGLIAEGGAHPDSIIVFTDYRDDFYGGDTNADTARTNPYDPSFWIHWRGIQFQDESLDPLCRLSYASVRYAGQHWWPYVDIAGIITNNASPTITHSLIADNRVGVRINGSSNPVINYCDIRGNMDFGIHYPSPAFSIDARWNWWGANSGPTHASNPGGTGDVVTDGIDYSSFRSEGAMNPRAGDVSLNGFVQAFDASRILKFVVNPRGADSLNTLQKLVADVSGNGGADTVAITAHDASLILQHVVGTLVAFPVEVNRKGLPTEPVKRPVSVTLSRSAAGRVLTVPITIDRVEQLASWQTIVDFDAAALRVIEMSGRGATSAMQWASAVESGRWRIAAAASAPSDAEGTLAELTFEVLDEARLASGAPVRLVSFLVNEVETASSATGVEHEDEVPAEFALLQNYPNPFNPSTTIEFRVPHANATVRIAIYNMLGQLVRTLVDGPHAVGTHRVVWDGRNDAGEAVGTGTYIYQLRTKDVVQSKKLTLVK